MSTEQPSCVQPRPLKDPQDSALPMHEPSGSRACAAEASAELPSSVHTEALEHATIVTAIPNTIAPTVVRVIESSQRHWDSART
jgi:hypothetical protein